MAELEELQLRVTLDDQASAQIAALRGQLDQMRGAGSAAAQVQQAAPQIVGAIAAAVQQLTAMGEQIAQLPAQITAAMSSTVQGLQQVQTQLTQVGTQIQQTAQGVAGIPGRVQQGAAGLAHSLRQASFFGNLAAEGTKEFFHQLTRIGDTLIKRSIDFQGLADSMQDLEKHARGVGMSMAGYQGLQRQLQLGGMTAEQAKGTISQLSDLNLELQHYGAEFAPATRRVLQNVSDPATFKYLSEMMKQMEGAPIEKQINLINEALENMRATMTKRGQAGGFEAARKEFLENLGLSPEAWANVEEGFRARKETAAPDSVENLRGRTEETRKFNYESLKASFYWKDIGDSLAGILLHGINLNNNMGELNTWLEKARGHLVTFERVYRETGSFEEAVKALDPAWAPFARALHDAYNDLSKVGDQIREWKARIVEVGTALTDMWNSLPEGLRDMLSGKFMQKTRQEPPPQISGREPGYMEKLDPYSNYSTYERLKRQGMSDEQLRAYFEKYKNAPPVHAWDPLRDELGLGKPPVEPPAPAPPAEGTGLPPEQLERLRRRYRRGPVPPETQPLPEIKVEPQPPPPPAPEKTPDWYRRKMERSEGGGPIIVPPQERERSLFDFQPTSAPPPGIEKGGAANLDPNRFTKFPLSKAPMEDIRPPGGGPFRSMWDPPTYSTEELKAAEAEAWKTPAGKAQLKRGQELLAQQPSMETPMDRLSAMASKYLVERYKKTRLNESAGVPPASRFVDEAPWHAGPNEKQEAADSFQQRFGVWPGMGAEKIDQSASKLDQAANTNVNISGAGKIRVDVNAPPGTSVDASGEGFFKSTEITRMTSMLPADFGPGPVTGISAGQGASANGTATA